jgi:hypothetical protein
VTTEGRVVGSADAQEELIATGMVDEMRREIVSREMVR